MRLRSDARNRLAIWLWHPCVDVYVSNPQATVVARSDRHGAGRKPGRAVAETHARARGASADRVRGRAPWRSCPNRAGTRRRLAVAAIGGIRSRLRSWSATACRHDRGHVARPFATRSSRRHSRGPSRRQGQLGGHCLGHGGHFRRGPPAHAGGATGRPVNPQAGVSGGQRVEYRGTWARRRTPVRRAARRPPAARWWYRGRPRGPSGQHRCAPFPRGHGRARRALGSAGG